MQNTSFNQEVINAGIFPFFLGFKFPVKVFIGETQKIPTPCLRALTLLFRAVPAPVNGQVFTILHRGEFL